MGQRGDRMVFYEGRITASERQLRGRTRLFDEALPFLRKAYEQAVLTHETADLRIVLERVADPAEGVS